MAEKSKGKDVLVDQSDLSDIENVKGNETFEKKGSELSWQAEGNDIYYQGTTTKEAPVTNGKVLSNGNGNIVTGIAMPGLKESLNVNESDFAEHISIPDYVEVTADAQDFEMDMTMTIVTGLSEFSSDSSLDLSELDDKIDDLESAAKQLKDGSGELSEGLGGLNGKMGEFTDGTGALQNGPVNQRRVRLGIQHRHFK